jgi:DNA-binding HxlR family transcriptional regulator
MSPVSDYEQPHDKLRDACPVRATLDVIRGRWKPCILFEVKDGARRFSYLQKTISGITPQTLTVQLRQLEADGILDRKISAGVPPCVEYTLSDFGKTLSEVMDRMEDWGAEYLRRQASKKKRTARKP